MGESGLLARHCRAARTNARRAAPGRGSREAAFRPSRHGMDRFGTRPPEVAMNQCRYVPAGTSNNNAAPSTNRYTANTVKRCVWM